MGNLNNNDKKISLTFKEIKELDSRWKKYKSGRERVYTVEEIIRDIKKKTILSKVGPRV